MHPLVAEAMKKAAVAWIAVAQAPAYPVWCLWADDALFMVSGPGEQPAPGLADADRVMVTGRGDHGGQIVTWLAQVDRLAPDSEVWEAVVPQLAGKRLNSSDSTHTAQRWAAECAVYRLAPADDALAARPDTSLAAPPRPSPAVRVTRKPFRLHRVKKRRP